MIFCQLVLDNCAKALFGSFFQDSPVFLPWTSDKNANFSAKTDKTF